MNKSKQLREQTTSTNSDFVYTTLKVYYQEDMDKALTNQHKAILEEVREKVIGKNVGDKLNQIASNGKTYNEYSVYGKDKQILINEFKEEMRQKLSLLERKYD